MQNMKLTSLGNKQSGSIMHSQNVFEDKITQALFVYYRRINYVEKKIKKETSVLRSVHGAVALCNMLTSNTRMRNLTCDLGDFDRGVMMVVLWTDASCG